jgi:uncharacterized protein
MAEHFAYLQNLLKNKKLILAGPCLDGAFGIVIFEASSQEEAGSIMKNDPSIKSGIMRGELHNYKISLSKK